MTSVKNKDFAHISESIATVHVVLICCVTPAEPFPQADIQGLHDYVSLKHQKTTVKLLLWRQVAYRAGKQIYP